MSNLKDQLIKLGSENPELQKHLKPILDTFDERDATSPESFEEWKSEVNSHVGSMAMLDIRDLPDQPYRDWYNSGIPPKEAAEMAIKQSGGGGLF